MFQTKKFYIAGVQHHQLHKVITDVVPGNYMILEPQPDNPFDPNAVRIIYDNGQKREMVGFVPKKFSSEVAAALEIETPLVCEVVTISPASKPWEQLEVEIKEFVDEGGDDLA